MSEGYVQIMRIVGVLPGSKIGSSDRDGRIFSLAANVSPQGSINAVAYSWRMLSMAGLMRMYSLIASWFVSLVIVISWESDPAARNDPERLSSSD